MDNLRGCNIDFRNLIMGKLVKIHEEEDIENVKKMMSSINDINLPKKQVLTIFNNVKQLELDLFVLDNGYLVSLSSLISCIRSYPSLKMVRIDMGEGAIIPSYYLTQEMKLLEELKQKYENVGYNIHMIGTYRMSCVIKRS